MSYELECRFIQALPERVISEKFKVREFFVIIEQNNGGQIWTEYHKFQLTNDKCDLIDNFAQNDEIKVYFNIGGRKWEKDGKENIFNSSKAWKVEKISSSSDVPNTPVPEVPMPDTDEDLPF